MWCIAVTSVRVIGAERGAPHAVIREITNNPTDEVMVRSIHSIARTMGLQTNAEFVENAEAVERLAAIDIDFVQGYHIGRPRPLEQLDCVKCMPR